MLHNAYLELAHGVQKAIDECGTDEWALARLGGYPYESDIMLRDRVTMYWPAGDALTDFLAREKSFAGTA